MLRNLNLIFLLFFCLNHTSIDLNRLNQKIEQEIQNKLFPGAVLAIIDKNNTIIKTYGHTDYSKKTAVTKNTIYDLASLTKILSTTLAIMILVEENKIDLHQDISTYFPDIPELKKIKVYELLTHESGLKDVVTKSNNIKDMFAKKTDKKFLYNDINMILIGKIIEKISQQSLDIFVDEKIYKPLKLKHTTYKALKKGFNLDQIAPTENDLKRNKLYHGEVHDEKAELLNGVSGNAGLFSNISDIARLCKILMQENNFLKKDTVKIMLDPKWGSYHALGFMKGFHIQKDIVFNKDSGYSHLGFTGTTLWIDFDNQFALILLTNRVHPNRNNQEEIREFREWLAEWLKNQLNKTNFGLGL